MSRNQALLVAFLFLGLFWYASPFVFDYTFAVNLPIIGPIFQYAPLSILSQYSVLIGGSFALLLYYQITKNERKSKS